MENNAPTLEDKKGMYAFFFENEAGEKFREILKDSRDNKLLHAEDAAQELQLPNEHIAAAVNQAKGIREIIDFIDSIEREVKAHKKQEGED